MARLHVTFNYIIKSDNKKRKSPYDAVDAGCGCCGESQMIRDKDQIEDLKDFIEDMKDQIKLAEEAIKFLEELE